MTPQEALAQALYDAKGNSIEMSDDEYAAAILAALPEGCVLITGEPEEAWAQYILDGARKGGAQQERERLWEVVKPVMDVLFPGFGRDPRFAAMWDAFHPEDDR